MCFVIVLIQQLLTCVFISSKVLLRTEREPTYHSRVQTKSRVSFNTWDAARIQIASSKIWCISVPPVKSRLLVQRDNSAATPTILCNCVFFLHGLNPKSHELETKPNPQNKSNKFTSRTTHATCLQYITRTENNRRGLSRPMEPKPFTTTVRNIYLAQYTKMSNIYIYIPYGVRTHCIVPRCACQLFLWYIS